VPTFELINALHIEKPMIDVMKLLLKGMIKRSMHNPNSHAAHKYNIVEDLVEARASTMLCKR